MLRHLKFNAWVGSAQLLLYLLARRNALYHALLVWEQQNGNGASRHARADRRNLPTGGAEGLARGGARLTVCGRGRRGRGPVRSYIRGPGMCVVWAVGLVNQVVERHRFERVSLFPQVTPVGFIVPRGTIPQNAGTS